MPTSYTNLLGLALPVTGELSGTWGQVTNDYITQYIDASVAGTQTISGSQTAVTLSTTTNASLAQAGSGATGSAQYAVINCTGNPASLLTVTAPAASKEYIVINATSTNQSVKIVGAGPTTGVTVVAGEKCLIAWNGSDFVKVGGTNGAGSFTDLTVTGNTTLGDGAGDTTTISGPATLSAGTANGVAYLNASKVLTTGSALTFDGTNFATTGTVTSAGASNSGNLTFTGTGNRITGDFSNATHTSRVMFQSSTTNGNTNVAAVPNGTATQGQFLAYGSSDIANANFVQVLDNGAEVSFRSSAQGTGTYLPMTFVTGGSERVRIDTSGNVGIGTSSPSGKLHVSGGRSYFTASSEQFGLALKYNASTSGVWLGSPGTDAFTISTEGGTERARITSGGDLLVGTTSAGARAVIARPDDDVVFRVYNALSSGTTFDVSQVISAQAAGTGFNLLRLFTSNGGAAQFAVRADGTVYAQNTTIQSISDARVKENIRDASDGLATILGLRTVRFDFKAGFGNNRKNQLGFIAQEVEAVFPDAVDCSGEKDENGDPYKSVGPGALIPVLVKAIQEQQAIIESLKARLDAANL